MRLIDQPEAFPYLSGQNPIEECYAAYRPT
jgi:hypothetical protein